MFCQRRLNVFVIGACLSAVAMGAGALEAVVAELNRVSGKVMVNQGQDYVPGTGNMQLRPGFRVVTLEKSGALVTYRDGCALVMEENEILNVGSHSPCALGKDSKPLPAPPPLSAPPPLPAPPPLAAIKPNWIIPVGVAGVAATIIAISDGDNNRPPNRPPISQ